MTRPWKQIFSCSGAILLVLGPALARAESCATAADRAAVVQAVQTMFAAAARDNITLFHTATLPDFYAFDNGHQFRRDELMVRVRQLHAEGHAFVWKVTEPRVYLDCHVAGITEINRGSVDGKPTTWLESGVLKKVDGKWRVQFFNSARAVETPLSPTPPK